MTEENKKFLARSDAVKRGWAGRREKERKAKIIRRGERWFFIGLILIFLVGSALIIRRVNRRIANLEAQNLKLAVDIQATQKQIPLLTKYWLLVKELTDASKGELTAFEIVEISRIIMTECQANQDIGLTPALVMSLVERESSFNPKVISTAQAYGLMQVMESTFALHLEDLGYKRFSRDLALDPIVNVQVGVKELVRLRRYWLSYDIDSWLITTNSYFWGTRIVWELFVEKKRAKLPSLEYAKGILDLEKKWREKGL